MPSPYCVSYFCVGWLVAFDLQCLEVVSVDKVQHGAVSKPRITFSATRFHISPVFLSEKRSLISIVTTVSFVVDSTAKKFERTPFISFCNKPVITWLPGA